MATGEFLFSDIIAKNPHSWESGEYINYNLTISNETYQLSATPLEWTESPVNVIFDKQYYLKLSQTKVQTAGDGVTVNIRSENEIMMLVWIQDSAGGVIKQKYHGYVADS